ncbi:MAG: N-acetyltransferase [Paracoccaceae bacterium]|nr:N-acetyltransferase [Paracoccaceae bacterium]
MKDFFELNFRPAHAGDAEHLAKLIDIAGEGIPTWLWAKSLERGQSPLEVGVNRALRRTGGFSHRNATLAQSYSEIAGMVLSYPIDKLPKENPDDLPLPIAPFLELEKSAVGTWYINALAVFPAFQGIGIGNSLMEEAENSARQHGYDRVSIQVYEQNIGAVRLYERLGYSVTERAPVRHHPCQPYYTGDVLLLEKVLSSTV